MEDLVQANASAPASSEKVIGPAAQAGKGKTSTFVIHHDTCDPSKWTITEWKLLADFIKHGSLIYAAGLARRGMQLKLDDRLETTGGDVEHVGWARGNKGDFDFDTFNDDLREVAEDDLEVVEVVPIYRGPTTYAVTYATGDEEGFIDGYENETFSNPDDAEKFVNDLRQHVESEAASTDE